MEMQGDLTSEQRAYWESVIERDVRDRNKTKNYLTLDEFEQKLTAAAVLCHNALAYLYPTADVPLRRG